MKKTVSAGKVSSVPIIGIQHEVQTASGEIEVQVEYFVLNPDKFLESLDDPEDMSLLALLDAVNSGSSLLSDLRSKSPGVPHLVGSLFNDENAKTFYNAMGIVLDSNVVGKVVRFKVPSSRNELPINPGVN